ncbi:DUF4148 domain-containing protein [Nostoc sp. CHAB 5834]|nr:DUF4148 domain-containing protein [Nostoc sp. CHAB 5834]
MKKTLFALIAAAALPAFAFNPSAENSLTQDNFTSQRTRAEVSAEAIRGAQAGTLSRGEGSYVAAEVGKSKTRDQVKSELAQFVASGEAQKAANLLAGGV